MKHAELVQRAGAWLRGTKKCTVVLLEQPHGYSPEIPDAIGWAPGLCVVVECKSSIHDLRAEARKQHHLNGESMGDERWFLTPPGLVKPSALPFGHGLIEVRGPRQIRVVRPAPPRDVTWKRLRAECEYLRVELGESWRAIRKREADGTARSHLPPIASPS